MSPHYPQPLSLVFGFLCTTFLVLTSQSSHGTTYRSVTSPLIPAGGFHLVASQSPLYPASSTCPAMVHYLTGDFSVEVFVFSSSTAETMALFRIRSACRNSENVMDPMTSLSWCCRGDDYYTIELESDKARIPIVPVVDHNNGSYTALASLPLGGSDSYTLTVQLTHSLVQLYERPKPPTFTHFEGVDRRLIFTHERKNFKGRDLQRRRRRWCILKDNRRCITFTAPVDSSASSMGDRPRCPKEGYTYGQVGHWTKDDNKRKVGQSSPSWRYVEHRCRIPSWNMEDRVQTAQRCSSNKWVVFWGDSTLQQTALNLVEEVLGYSVNPQGRMENLTMEIIDQLGVFYYRQWDRTFDNGLRVTFVWAGCRDPNMCCPFCNKGEQGLNTLDKVEALLRAQKDGRVPSVIFTGHFGSWEPRTFDQPSYINVTRRVLNKLYNLTRRSTPLVWLYPTAESNETICLIPNLDFWHHSIQLLEKHLFDRSGPNAVLLPTISRIDRFHMSYPFRYGRRFAHSGNHYGNSEGVCRTYLGRKAVKYSSRYCRRDTVVDEEIRNALMSHVCPEEEF